jgi:hypothetical protein
MGKSKTHYSKGFVKNIIADSKSAGSEPVEYEDGYIVEEWHRMSMHINNDRVIKGRYTETSLKLNKDMDIIYDEISMPFRFVEDEKYYNKVYKNQ